MSDYLFEYRGGAAEITVWTAAALVAGAAGETRGDVTTTTGHSDGHDNMVHRTTTEKNNETWPERGGGGSACWR